MKREHVLRLEGGNLKKFLTVAIILFLIMAVACGGTPSTQATSTQTSTQAVSAQETPVNYTVSASHFVKSTYKGETNPSYVLIRSYASFDSLFGVAAVMGMDQSKLITEEKMKNGFVISIIYQGNDIHEFGIEKVTLKNKQLQVYYTSKVTTPNASWTCNCHVTTLIENCDFDSILMYENGSPKPDAIPKAV
jgi:hypothetical protein